MVITEIYNDFKKNLSKEQYEIEFNGENFRIYPKSNKKTLCFSREMNCYAKT